MERPHVGALVSNPGLQVIAAKASGMGVKEHPGDCGPPLWGHPSLLVFSAEVPDVTKQRQAIPFVPCLNS